MYYGRTKAHPRMCIDIEAITEEIDRQDVLEREDI